MEKPSNFTHYTFGDDMIFDERGNSFLAMRRVQWDRNGEGEDEKKARLELRRWRIDNECNERADKGFSFLTEDGPHNLAEGLVQNGYGHTKSLLQSLTHREDFKEAVDSIINNTEEEEGGEFFDAREYLENLA